MAKNRKNQSAAIRFGPVIWVVLLCSLFGGAGVGYVWQKSQIDELGRQRVKREKHLAELQLLNEKLRRQLDALQSSPNLEKSVKDLNLGLVPTQSSQFWRLSEPVAAPAPPAVERQYAQGSGTQTLR